MGWGGSDAGGPRRATFALCNVGADRGLARKMKGAEIIHQAVHTPHHRQSTPGQSTGRGAPCLERPNIPRPTTHRRQCGGDQVCHDMQGIPSSNCMHNIEHVRGRLHLFIIRNTWGRWQRRLRVLTVLSSLVPCSSLRWGPVGGENATAQAKAKADFACPSAVSLPPPAPTRLRQAAC